MTSTTLGPAIKKRAVVLAPIRSEEVSSMTQPGVAYIYRDSNDVQIRKVNSSGVATTVAVSDLEEIVGNGVTLGVTGTATAASMTFDVGSVVVDSTPSQSLTLYYNNAGTTLSIDAGAIGFNDKFSIGTTEAGATVVVCEVDATQMRVASGGTDMTLTYPAATTSYSLPAVSGVISSCFYNTKINGSFSGSSASNQNIFADSGALTLGLGVYKIEMFVRLLRSAGTTSRILGFGVDGTAVGKLNLNLVNYQLSAAGTQTITQTVINDVTMASTASAPVAFSAASIYASEDNGVHIEGRFTVTTAGTVIPIIKASAAVSGGSAALSTSTFCNVTKMDATQTNVRSGNWA